jgi:hypothetical protein
MTIKIQNAFKNNMLLGIVAHACNSSYSGGGDQEDLISRPAQVKKLVRPPSQQISQAWWYVPVIPATQEAIGRSI